MNKPWLKDAKELHKDQMYGDKPFSYHLDMVSKTVEALYGEGQYLSCIAAFHDGLEDKVIDVTRLLYLLNSYDDFDTWGIDINIAPAILAITKNKQDTRKQYLLKVKENRLATKVKIADAMCNLRECLKDGNLSRAQYYQDTLDTLLDL